MGCAALAIGPGDMHGAEFALRMSQMLAEGDGIAQVLFKRSSPYALKHRELAIEEVKRLLIVHTEGVLLVFDDKGNSAL